MNHAPTGRESSGSDPALSMSVFYSTGWHFSFFPSFLCACVSLFSWCNEPPLCCQQRMGRITATARRSCSPLSISGTHCKSVIGHLNPTLKGYDWFLLFFWCSLPDSDLTLHDLSRCWHGGFWVILILIQLLYSSLGGEMLCINQSLAMSALKNDILNSPHYTASTLSPLTHLSG